MPTARVLRLLTQALELPPKERLELLDELARTLPDSEDPDLDYDELDRRMKEVLGGTAVVVPWEEARRLLL